MTLLELVQNSGARLDQAGVSFGHGTTNSFDEAVWLVLWRLGWLPDALQARATDIVSADRQQQVEAFIGERIHSRKPAAYLTGEAWLQGVPFTVDERVIVPRSLIAEPLADGTLDAWLSDRTETVLDLCTGNGSLAVLAALAWPEVRVTATDLSIDALVVARRNVERHRLADRITLLQGDGLQAAPGPFDLILCNPPYVNRASMAALPAEYRAEPALALDGGVDGMDFVRALIAQVPRHLSERGVLVLEVGNERAHFEAAFPRLEVVWLPTNAGDDHVLLLERQSLR